MTIETTAKTTLDLLNRDSVSILKQEFAIVNDTEVQVGQNFRRAFTNSENGRKEIAEFLNEPYLTSVMAVWGDAPTVAEQVTESAEAETTE